jgi:predicted O-linked N-acetylglucosamine transferase (SPINDLY family)
LFCARGALQDARAYLSTALERKPDFPEARVVLSSVYDAQGNPTAAAAELEAALAQRPDYTGALYNYALVLRKLRRLTEAASALRRILVLDPDYPNALYQLGSTLWGCGELDDAERLLRAALGREPESAEAHVALHYVYKSRQNLDLAVVEMESALRLRPDWGEAWYSYGAVLNSLLRLPEAEAAFRRAIAIDAGFAAAYRMLAGILVNQIRMDEALEFYKAGRERDPDGFVEATELFALNFSDDISTEALFARHKAFGERMEQRYPARFEPFRNAREPERRLRIGYVSGDFNSHPVALFLIPLIERHDRSAHQIYCYSLSEETDEVTPRIAERADVWRLAASRPSAEAADMIHRDEIDLLVDLSGHTGVPSFSIFAQRPAPVQVAWLGYLQTTGLTRIQYRLCDGYTDPPGVADRLHTETLVRLPHTQWCYRPVVSLEAAPAPPCQRNGFITFGSFNQAAKLSRTVRRLWAQILTRLPDSRLFVLGIPDGPARDILLRDLEAQGVARARILIEPRLGLEYFHRFNTVDIALDTTPYSGGTTTCDALWMGVPVVTCPGSRPVSRSAASILSSVGLPDWIASTPEDYVRRAVEFAGDVEVLDELRRSLRERMRASALMDEPRFVRDVEQAYRRMWRAWCD